MQLDIRLPLGLMLVALGAILVGYGILGDAAVYQKSMGINVNLWWGAVLVVVGGVMLVLAKRKTK